MDRETGQHWEDRINPDGEDGAEFEELSFIFKLIQISLPPCPLTKLEGDAVCGHFSPNIISELLTPPSPDLPFRHR